MLRPCFALYTVHICAYVFVCAYAVCTCVQGCVCIYVCVHVCNVAQCYVVMLLKSVYALCLGICDFWNYKIYLIQLIQL